MSVTRLDPNTALVVIDLQKGIVALPPPHAVAPVIERTRELLDAFRSRGLPVVLVNVAGGAPGRTQRQPPSVGLAADWTELIAELNRQPGDHLVTKKTWGAFTGTDLDAYLKAAGVTQIVLAGIATSIGIESTARHAFELGYNVTFAIDAMTDANPDAHANSIERIFPRVGETGSTADIVALLDRRGA
ncbi:isochorismatase family protein [Burkholderia dolosa]|jgi:nicotinamidase-related amidase|uniref:Isochorismatase family protein n=1 Tax=Burkholderia dolosa TaxID=152500 RepID=A0A892IEW5_9BURK|nr:MULTISPECIES: isochorismatase family protein [Burkholderia]AKE06059.1 hydrolase [Burkholderia cepacia]AJY09641.1 isochorismatase family protein [Burkholderia dolosa AU0158]AYZ95258.1 isochorismatase family protein [Burkholderia dolosa]EAY70666.1 Isochorismatase hydrolase [Burkholderia dolosa AU0158]ETP62671.1 hydrolase [Burkholderia dolosa PC543]